jgi:hypothetical protein
MRVFMKYYVYYDGYGNAKKAIGEEDLAVRYGNNPDSFLKEMLGGEAGEGDLGGKGYVSVVNFESEQERDEYLETLGEKISSYGGCRSQCQ